MTARDLHGRTLAEIVERFGDAARGVFLRALTRRGQEVPMTPGTRIYVGDVMTLVGLNNDLNRVVPQVGQAFRSSDRTDIAFLASGLAVGLLVGLLSLTDRPDSADARRRRRRAGRRAGLRLAALAPADDGSVPAGGAAIPDAIWDLAGLSPPSGWPAGRPRWPPSRPTGSRCWARASSSL